MVLIFDFLRVCDVLYKMVLTVHIKHLNIKCIALVLLVL